MTNEWQTRQHVTIQCDHVAPIVYNFYPAYVFWLGTIQLVGGVVLFALGIAGMVLGIPLAEISFALVLMTCLAGAFGIAAGRKKRICQVTTSMIFSILTAVQCSAVVLLTSILLHIASLNLPGSNDLPHQGVRYSSVKEVLIVILTTALIEAVVSIVLSCVGCHFSCFCCKQSCCDFDTTTTQQVVMIAGDHTLRNVSTSAEEK